MGIFEDPSENLSLNSLWISATTHRQLMLLRVGQDVWRLRGQFYRQAARVRNAGANSLRYGQLARLACFLCCVLPGNTVDADDAIDDGSVTTARTSTLSERPAVFVFEYDNDLFAGTDRDYTGATRFAWSPAGSPTSGERTLFTLSQDAWTPDDIGADRPPDGEHPYAGWLYLSAARATAVGDGSLLRYASIGVLGPSSRAESVQNFLHQVSGSRRVNGWNSQRSDRAAIQLGLRRDVSVLRRQIVPGGELDLGVHAGAAIGSVMGYLHAGASLRIGRGTTRTVGPPDTVPGAPDFAAAFSPANTRYIHVGVGARAIGWDDTLNADTSRAPAVDFEPLVAEVRTGIVTTRGDWRFAYTYTRRTKSYRTGLATHAFGSLNIARLMR